MNEIIVWTIFLLTSVDALNLQLSQNQEGSQGPPTRISRETKGSGKPSKEKPAASKGSTNGISF